MGSDRLVNFYITEFEYLNFVAILISKMLLKLALDSSVSTSGIKKQIL